MDSSGSRVENFPAGLRVLVVDDDLTWLKILEKMLRKCSYEVTTCNRARDALDKLRERRDRFDIVISDVNMPDMDGFKLLESVGLEMDLPVIMMSVDGETSRVMKGVQHGACDYLLKPVRMKELKNIWQHVLRKRIHEGRDIELHDSSEDFQLMRNKYEYLDGRHTSYGSDTNSPKKRKDVNNNRELADHNIIDPFSVKKARVVWSVDLHQKFVSAVNQIGFDKVGPKKILDLMNIPGLTRENVASHLQKYRLYLSRIQKQHEGASFGILQHEGASGITSTDVMDNACSLDSSQKVLGNSLNCSGKRLCSRGTIQEVNALDSGSDTSQGEDFIKFSSGYIGSQNIGKNMYSDSVRSPNGTTPSIERKSRTFSNANENNWEGGIPAIQVGQNPMKQQQFFNSLSEYQHIRPLQFENATSYVPSVSPSTTSGWAESCSFSMSYNKSLDCKSEQVSILPMIGSATDSISIKVEPGTANSILLSTTTETEASMSVRSHYPDQYLIDIVDCMTEKINSVEDNSTRYPGKEIIPSIQENNSLHNLSLANMDLRYNVLTPVTEVPAMMYEGPELDYEYNFDWMDCTTNGGGGLFT